MNVDLKGPQRRSTALPMDPKDKLLLKYPEACGLLSVGETKLREQVAAGLIHPVKIGLRGIRFPIEEILRWKAECAVVA